MKVQILHRKLIAPSCPTPTHLRNLKLSSVEQLCPIAYTGFILYYAASNEEGRGANFIEERSKKMQKSLAETLTLLYPFAGRYANDNLSIDCNDKGAEYVEAKVNGSLAQLLGKRGGTLDSELLYHLTAHPSHDEPDKIPLLLVQCSMFECGGVAISLNLSHQIMDAFTAITIARTWASTACGIGIGNLDYVPSFPLASICPPKDELSSTRLRLQSTADDTIVHRSFLFNRATISKLKALAKASGSHNSALLKYHPSRVEVVAAIVWRMLVRASQARHGRLRPSSLLQGFDIRSRTAIRFPECSCGLLLSTALSEFIPDDSESNMEFHDFVNLVHDGIRSAMTDFARVSNGDDLFFQVAANWRKLLEANSKSEEVDPYSCSSWCGFPLYELDFGWGKPAWASSMSLTKGFFVLMDNKDGDGVEVFMGLDEKSMHLFQQSLNSMLGFIGNELQQVSPSTSGSASAARRELFHFSNL